MSKFYLILIVLLFSFFNIFKLAVAKKANILPFNFEGKTSIAIFNVYTNEIEYYYKQNELLIPASTMKLITSINALSFLGPYYNFEVSIYKTQDNLIISSNYNPSLIEEIIPNPYEILRESIREILTANLVNNIKKVYIESVLPSYFPESWKIYEGEPFAPYLSTFSFNQNMIKIQKVQNNFIIYPPVFDEFKSYNKIISLISNLREIDGAFWYIYPSPEEYNKRVIKKIFKEIGYEVEVEFLNKSLDGDINYLGSFPTATLLETLKYQNYYSDNFVSQQIYNKLKYELKLDLSNMYRGFGIVIDDGCGLSRKNKISSYFLAYILSKADDFELINYLAYTLPGYNEGTLNKRNLPITVKAKTGTLNDVSSLAGYVKTKKNNWYSFCIIYNGPNVYNAKINEEKIVNYIYNNW